MGPVDYEREALKVLGLPHPADEHLDGFHEIGSTGIVDSPEACKIVVARRLARIRRVLQAAHILPYAARGKIEEADFLTHGEYLDAVRRIVSIRERLQKIENAERRQDFNRRHRPNLSFHAEHLAPTPLEEQLSRLFDPDRHMPDWPGYMAYLAAVAPSLCAFFYRRLPVLIPEDARRRHTYITGQSGSGKSELLKVLVDSYVRSAAPVSLVLIDPHGDLAEQVARLPEVAASGRLVYLNPSLASGFTPTINPFELADLSEQSVHVTAEQIASVFGELMRRAGHAALTGNMGALLVPCISSLLLRPGSTILDLQTFMDDKRNGELVEAGSRSPVPSHRDFFLYHFGAKQFDSTKAALYTRIQSLLNSPVLYRLLVGPSTVNLEEAVNGGKIIVFSLPKGGIGTETSPTFGSFVLATLQGIAIRRENVPAESRVPVHLFVDECQNFLSPSVKTILEESRKFGLHLTLAQQTFAQDMDKELAAAVVGNTAVKVCGMNDVKTLKPMDERMGVGLDALQRLEVGRFFVKVSGDRPAFKLTAPRIRAAITDEAWDIAKAAQLRTYYRPNVEPSPEVPETPAEADRLGDRTQAALHPEKPVRTKQTQPEGALPRPGPRKPRKIEFV